MTEERKKIAIIDDYEGDRNLYTKYLAMTGDYEVNAFPSHGAASIWLENNKVDLIITDDSIKGQAYNGFQWTRTLRDSDSLNAATPVMICAASHATLEHATDAGAQMLLSMPISIERFTEVVEVLLMTQSPLLPPATVEPQKPVVVAIDDEPAILRIYTRALQREYDIRTFSSPKEANEKLLDHTVVDLVISDDLMGGEKGTEWLKKRRESDSPNRNTPTFIVSGTAKEEEALEAGAQAMICKPFNLQELKDTMRQWIDRKPARGPLDHAARDDDTSKGRG